MLRIKDLQYGLMPANLEGTPREIRLGRRDLGRLLLVDRERKAAEHSYVRDLPELLAEGDVLVLNNSKRIPGVLRGRTEFGGKVELRFVDLDDDGSGLCRIFPRHDIREGSIINLDGGQSVRVIATSLTKYELGRVVACEGTLRKLLVEQGTPILGFFYEGAWSTSHLNPFYANEEGSVESPLAGLHFTSELVDQLEQAGVEVCFVTLHSVGSWLPFLEESVEDHEMWSEWFRVPQSTVDAIARARLKGRRVIACGSTSLRALEAASRDGRRVACTEGRTQLYVKPGYTFHVVDAYFTNFHQYQTSLIVLDAAFAGRDLVMSSYEEAKRQGYAFYEFGDAVLYL